MKIRSNLPEDLGSAGEGWYASIPDHLQEEGGLEFKALGSVPDVDDDSSWISEYPGVIELVRVVDESYRERFEVDPDKPTAHSIDVRSGAGNIAAYHQLKLASTNWIPYYPTRLRQSMVHADVFYSEQMPTEEDPAALYTVVTSTPTEWFEGEYVIPTPLAAPRHRALDIVYSSAYLLLMGGYLRAQVNLNEAWTGEENHLLLASKTDVHRMPPIPDVLETQRVFFRDYVSSISDTGPEEY